MRTKNQVHALTGHLSTVSAIQCQPSDPQIITGKSLLHQMYTLNETTIKNCVHQFQELHIKNCVLYETIVSIRELHNQRIT
jgi:hypothetical protein